MSGRPARGPHDPMWDAPRNTLEQVAARRAYFGHQDERDTPGYRTCGELCRDCPERPRRWRWGWTGHWPGDGCEEADLSAETTASRS